MSNVTVYGHRIKTQLIEWKSESEVGKTTVPEKQT